MSISVRTDGLVLLCREDRDIWLAVLCWAQQKRFLGMLRPVLVQGCGSRFQDREHPEILKAKKALAVSLNSDRPPGYIMIVIDTGHDTQKSPPGRKKFQIEHAIRIVYNWGFNIPIIACFMHRADHRWHVVKWRHILPNAQKQKMAVSA